VTGDKATVDVEGSFCNIVLEAIDEGLTSLGESSKKKIYFHLEKTFGIRKRQIPLRINDFSDALERIFGSSAKHLEILLIKRLHTKVQTRYKGDASKWVASELTFEEYVRIVKRSFK